MKFLIILSVIDLKIFFQGFCKIFYCFYYNKIPAETRHFLVSAGIFSYQIIMIYLHLLIAAIYRFSLHIGRFPLRPVHIYQLLLLWRIPQ